MSKVRALKIRHSSRVDVEKKRKTKVEKKEGMSNVSPILLVYSASFFVSFLFFSFESQSVLLSVAVLSPDSLSSSLIVKGNLFQRGKKRKIVLK